MDVSIRGRNVELTDALRAAAEEKVTRLSRFLDGMDDVGVPEHSVTGLHKRNGRQCFQ